MVPKISGLVPAAKQHQEKEAEDKVPVPEQAVLGGSELLSSCLLGYLRCQKEQSSSREEGGHGPLQQSMGKCMAEKSLLYKCQVSSKEFPKAAGRAARWLSCCCPELHSPRTTLGLLISPYIPFVTMTPHQLKSSNKGFKHTAATAGLK